MLITPIPFIKWETSAKDLAASVGRLDYAYTGLGRSTSSKKTKTMERTLVANIVMPGEVIGLCTKGDAGDFPYQTQDSSVAAYRMSSLMLKADLMTRVISLDSPSYPPIILHKI